MSNLEIDAAEIIAEAEKFITENPGPTGLAHEEVLEEILAHVEPVDFRAEAGLDNADKIPQKNLIVITIREVLRVAKSLDCGLCKNGDFIYCFNGAYWKLLERDVLKDFLGRAAEKCGVDQITAEHYQFRTHLHSP